MEFAGPDAADFANVRSLNKAFLALARAGKLPRHCLQELDEKLAARLLGLTEHQAERLAMTPFLLFSFRERDSHYWDLLLAEQRSGDLFAVSTAAGDDVFRLTAAGLGFVWQLAQRNPYAARVIAGASLYWCERISERTFFRLLAIAGMRSDLLVLRFASDGDLWLKLLNGGVVRQESVRRSTHLSALQSVLTRNPSEERVAWSTAARRIDRRGTRVAEEPGDR